MMPKTIDLSPMPDIPGPSTDSVGLLQTAEIISERATSMLSDDEIDPVEAAGYQALASLLIMHANGDLPVNFSMAMLKSLALSKTPNPVTKVEQIVKVDLNVVFSKLVDSSPDTLDRMIGLAKERGEQVRLRLGTGNDYMLPGVKGGEQDTPNQEKKTEPPEIIDIRAGGDGSARRNTPNDFPTTRASPVSPLYDSPTWVSFADKYKKSGDTVSPHPDCASKGG